MAGDEIDESQGICVDNLSFIISRHGALTKNDRSCITDNYHVSIHLSYLVCLSFIIPRHGALAKNDRSCITDNYHVIIYVSYLVCLSFIIPRRGAALVPWQRAIDLVLLTVIMSLSYLVCLSYHYSVASPR
jgi:hypothetical protein